jgi:transposase
MILLLLDGIENFWNQAKRNMCRFNGIPLKHFTLFLKEYEWLYNNPNTKAQIKQIKQIKQWIKYFMG